MSFNRVPEKANFDLTIIKAKKKKTLIVFWQRSFLYCNFPGAEKEVLSCLVRRDYFLFLLDVRFINRTTFVRNTLYCT